MDISLDQPLDMTIPYLSVQVQSFSIFSIEPAHSSFMSSTIYFLLIILLFFEYDMISDFNGTISNMK